MKRRNVLMIEDDADDRYITDKYFIDSGYNIKVDYFPSGDDNIIDYMKGLEPTELPHLILMSGTYGLYTLKRLKAHETYRQIPVIILTEMSHNFTVNEAYQLGANSVIQKPSTHQLTRDKIDSFSKYWFNTVELPT